MNLAEKLQKQPPHVRPSTWDGYEHFKGYTVMMLPLSSGYLLGLRMFPENDFAPYKSVWMCTPDGEWSIYNDGPSLKTTCPRWWGPALKHAELLPIELTWTASNELHVRMESPHLEWRMQMQASPPLRFLNVLLDSVSLEQWRSARFRQIQEYFSKRFLGMGDLKFAFVTPSGQETITIPKQIYFITSAKVEFNGRDLGHPVKLEQNPTIGQVPLPVRPVFMVGEAHATINNPVEYERTRKMVV